MKALVRIARWSHLGLVLVWAGPNRPAARSWPGWHWTGTGESPGPGCGPASARNWRGFDDACRSQNVFTDIPIIEASFWLTAAGMAR